MRCCPCAYAPNPDVAAHNQQQTILMDCLCLYSPHLLRVASKASGRPCMHLTDILHSSGYILEIVLSHFAGAYICPKTLIQIKHHACSLPPLGVLFSTLLYWKQSQTLSRSTSKVCCTCVNPGICSIIQVCALDSCVSEDMKGLLQDALSLPQWGSFCPLLICSCQLHIAASSTLYCCRQGKKTNT